MPLSKLPIAVLIPLFALVIYAALTDVKSRRIPQLANWHRHPSSLCGSPGDCRNARDLVRRSGNADRLHALSAALSSTRIGSGGCKAYGSRRGFCRICDLVGDLLRDGYCRSVRGAFPDTHSKKADRCFGECGVHHSRTASISCSVPGQCRARCKKPRCTHATPWPRDRCGIVSALFLGLITSDRPPSRFLICGRRPPDIRHAFIVVQYRAMVHGKCRIVGNVQSATCRCNRMLKQ